MLIEDPDSLKSWLVGLLKPLCEADPEALAKYVMALVKKDKPEEELRKSCLDQLDVFLQSNTSEFVDTFFKSVHDKSYLNPNPQPQLQQSQQQQQQQQDPAAVQQKPAAAVPHSNNNTSSSAPSVPSANPVTDVADESSINERRSNRRSSRSRSPVRKSGSSRNRSDDHRRGGSSRYDRKRDTDRDLLNPKSFSSSSRRRSNSRSPSPSRRRNRSRDRSRSPAAVHDGSKMGQRKRSASKSPDRDVVKQQRKERCRDFDERGFCMRGDQCPFVDSHSDPVVLDAEPFLNHRTQAPASAGLLPPPGTTAAMQEYDPRNPGMDMPSQRPLLGLPAGVPAVPNPNYPPPVGQWSVSSAPPPAYVPTGRPNLNVIIPEGPTADMSQQQQQQSQQGMHGMNLQSTVTVVNNHSSHHNPHSQMMHHHQNSNPHLMHQHQHQHQHLQQQQQHSMMQMQHQMMSSGHQQQHHNARGRGRGGFGGRGRGRGGFGGRGGGPGMMSGRMGPHDQPERCTLEVRRLPSHLNTIASLNDYFSKFGTIVNLQIKYDNDPEGAVVQFASHSEAAAAHRCPEAVLGNRFIKLFWHNKDQEKQDPAPEKSGHEEGTEGDDRPIDRSAENGSENRSERNEAGGDDDDEEDSNRLPVKERLDLKPLEDASFKLQLPKAKPSRPVLNPNLLRKSNLEKAGTEIIVPMIKTRSEQKKEKLLKNIEIRKKTESLLDSLRKDQGSVADKMMTAKTKEERSTLKRLFDVLDLKRKKVEEDLKRISEELLNECGKGSMGRKRPVMPVKQAHGQLVKNAVEIKKKMLDRELDQISESNRKTHDHPADPTMEPAADAEAVLSQQQREADLEQEVRQEDEPPSDLSDPLDANVKLVADV